MRDKDKNWQPPTLESVIEFQTRRISKDAFGVGAEDGFILKVLQEKNEAVLAERARCQEILKNIADAVYKIPLSKNLNSNEDQAGWAFKSHAAQMIRDTKL